MRRTIAITSEPSGALVWLNGREIGRTPVEVEFLYYGEYDVQLVAEGCEPLLTSGKADAPIWDNVPLDLIAEITPPRKHSRIAWHYQLQPPNNDPVALLERAATLRDRLPPPPSPSDEPPADPVGRAQPTNQADDAGNGDERETDAPTAGDPQIESSREPPQP